MNTTIRNQTTFNNLLISKQEGYMDQQVQLQPQTLREIKELTEKVKVVWKNSVQGIIVIGRCLSRLKEIMPREQYIKHIQEQFGMNEMHAFRLISVYKKFGNATSLNLLASKPSVLYLLATSENLDKVERLAAGEKILIGNQKKSIEEITVKEAMLIKQTTVKKSVELTDKQIDLKRAENAHREIATFIERVDDLAKDLIRYRKSNIEIKEVGLIKQYIKDTIICLKELDAILQ